MNIGDRVKFKTIGGWYNSGIIRDMNEESYLIEVDESEGIQISLPYYARILLSSCEIISEKLVAQETVTEFADRCRECGSKYGKLLRQDRETGHWIPVSERLPEDLEPVNITWVNHNPESYYADIKDKPFAATGVYFNGQWYWWSTLCTDMLAEYSHNYDDIIDDDVEITAWMPLPKPYEPQESEG